MAVELDPSGDFDQILDAAEALTLHRQGTSIDVAIAGARRFSSVTAPSETLGATQQEAIWQFTWQDPADPPRVGDTLTNDDGGCWTIIQVDWLAGDTRFRCTGRELRILHGLDSWVDVEQAVWDDLGGGPEIVDWQTFRPALPARLEAEQTDVDNEADPPTSTTTYRVTLGERLELDHNHRLVGPDGTIYQIVEFKPVTAIDGLPVAQVQQVATS